MDSCIKNLPHRCLGENGRFGSPRHVTKTGINITIGILLILDTALLTKSASPQPYHSISLQKHFCSTPASSVLLGAVRSCGQLPGPLHGREGPSCYKRPADLAAHTRGTGESVSSLPEIHGLD